MISSSSSHKLFATTAAFGVFSLLFAFNAGKAHGGDLLGGVAGAVGGALGGVAGALGGGGHGAPGGAGGGDGAGAQSARGMATGKDERGLAIGKKKLRRVVIVEDAEDCGDTLLDFLRRQDCNDWHTARGEADGDQFDQVSYAPVDEPLIRKPKSTKKAGKLQPPVRKKATASLVDEPLIRKPKSAKKAGKLQPPVRKARKKATAPKPTARLNIEKPSVEKPKLTVDPKLIKPKPKPKPDAVEKAQPKSEPTLSCDKAGAIVGGYGFSAINPSDCDGRVYAFNASRDGKSFTVTLNSVSGELIEVRKVP